jgi:hypothetical protein
MPADLSGLPGILIGLDLLVADGTTAARPLDDTALVLERLGWIGRPIVVAGDNLNGRRLPEAGDDRVTWVQTVLHSDGQPVSVFSEGSPRRVGEHDEDRPPVEAWAALRDTWRATWLLTSRTSSIGPARGAGLGVIRIGPRPGDGSPEVERPDHQARDALDATTYLLTLDTFAGPRSS